MADKTASVRRMRQNLNLSNTLSYSMLTHPNLQHLPKAFRTRAMLIDHLSFHSGKKNTNVLVEEPTYIVRVRVITDQSELYESELSENKKCLLLGHQTFFWPYHDIFVTCRNFNEVY
jgi:hypothetical protein